MKLYHLGFVPLSNLKIQFLHHSYMNPLSPLLLLLSIFAHLLPSFGSIWWKLILNARMYIPFSRRHNGWLISSFSTWLGVWFPEVCSSCLTTRPEVSLDQWAAVDHPTWLMVPMATVVRDKERWQVVGMPPHRGRAHPCKRPDADVTLHYLSPSSWLLPVNTDLR